MFSKDTILNLPKDIIINTINRYKGHKRCLQKSDIYQNVKHDEFIDQKSKYFDNGILDSNKKFSVDENINHLTGWVPYIKDKTSILIYNFFSVNYSIRKNLVLKISILKNHKVYFSKFLSLKQYDIIELGKNFFDLKSIKNGIIVVQVYHPKISKKHGGGQFRYWSKYYDEEDNYMATVHSMPLNYKKYTKEKHYGRNYFPNHKISENKNINASLQLDDVKEGDIGLSMGGYNMVLDKQDNPLAIWHMGPAYNIKNESLEIKKYYHCLWIPKNENINPRIIVDNKETFLGDSQEQVLKIKIISNNKIIQEKELKFSNFFESTINEIFETKFQFDYIIFLEFYSKLFSYLQINYDNKSIGDQVHTHRANFYYDDTNNLKFFNEEKEKNCRKFMHIYFKNNEYTNYLVVHNAKLMNKKKKNIKIRYLDENHIEEVKNIEIEDDKILAIFNLNSLFEDKIKNSKLNKAVIQLESKDYNFDSTIFCHNQKNDKIAIDHLTGG